MSKQLAHDLDAAVAKMVDDADRRALGLLRSIVRRQIQERPAVAALPLVLTCNGCGKLNADGCDHCCAACLDGETCPACGPLRSAVTKTTIPRGEP